MGSHQERQLIPPGDIKALTYLKQAAASGKHWYMALLETIGMWSVPEELYNGRIYRYLLCGEAFDWMLLAERLCMAIDGLIPHDEKMAFLFSGKSPLNITAGRFKELIGARRYSMFLNYYYGITVEEALHLAVEDEVRKERNISGFHNDSFAIDDEIYRRIYTADKLSLLKLFRKEMRYPHLKSTTLTEMKEFTYWLFKYRFKNCDRARVASDTRKALDWLEINMPSQQDFIIIRKTADIQA